MQASEFDQTTRYPAFAIVRFFREGGIGKAESDFLKPPSAQGWNPPPQVRTITLNFCVVLFDKQY
jgi:hypothetical protein